MNAFESKVVSALSAPSDKKLTELVQAINRGEVRVFNNEFGTPVVSKDGSVEHSYKISVNTAKSTIKVYSHRNQITGEFDENGWFPYVKGKYIPNVENRGRNYAVPYLWYRVYDGDDSTEIGTYMYEDAKRALLDENNPCYEIRCMNPDGETEYAITNCGKRNAARSMPAA